MDNTDGLSIYFCVVHFIEATLGFFFLNKLKISIATRLVSLRVNNNLGILDLESSWLEKLEEVKIEEALLRKTTDVKTRKFVHSSLALLLVLLVSAISEGSLSNVHVVELLLEQSLGVGYLSVLGEHLGRVHHTHGRAHLLHHHGGHAHGVYLLLHWHVHHHGGSGVTKGYLAWHGRNHFAIKLTSVEVGLFNIYLII
jgi:hypothetical protein